MELHENLLSHVVLHCETTFKRQKAPSCCSTVSYFVSEGPGSLLKTRGGSLDRSLFIDRQLDAEDSARSSSSSVLLFLLLKSWTSVSLRGKTVTLTVSSGHKNQEIKQLTKHNQQTLNESESFLLLWVWGFRFITEVWRTIFGPVTLHRQTAGH